MRLNIHNSYFGERSGFHGKEKRRSSHWSTCNFLQSVFCIYYLILSSEQLCAVARAGFVPSWEKGNSEFALPVRARNIICSWLSNPASESNLDTRWDLNSRQQKRSLDCTSNSSYTPSDSARHVWPQTLNCHQQAWTATIRPLQGASECPPLALSSCCSHHTNIWLFFSISLKTSSSLTSSGRLCPAAQSDGSAVRSQKQPWLRLYSCYLGVFSKIGQLCMRCHVSRYP